MIKKSIVFVIVSLMFLSLNAQTSAYKIYTSEGVDIEYEDMVSQLMEGDIIFFGEIHNDPINHWLEKRLLKDVHQMAGKDPVVGAEMFEADDQLILNEYLQGLIREKNFKNEAKIWNNYETGYRPLVEYAKKNKLQFIATNIPRRYASVVSEEGFEGLDSLSKQAKEYIAPLPVKYDPELPGYKKMLKMIDMPGMKDHGNENLPKAQAIKDATMAHFILKHFDQESIFLHFNGTYHSNNKEGIVWYIEQENPDLSVKTIATVRQETLNELEDKHKDLADFILVVPADMTTTY